MHVVELRLLRRQGKKPTLRPTLVANNQQMVLLAVTKAPQKKKTQQALAAAK